MQAPFHYQPQLATFARCIARHVPSPFCMCRYICDAIQPRSVPAFTVLITYPNPQVFYRTCAAVGLTDMLPASERPCADSTHVPLTSRLSCVVPWYHRFLRSSSRRDEGNCELPLPDWGEENLSLWNNWVLPSNVRLPCCTAPHWTVIPPLGVAGSTTFAVALGVQVHGHLERRRADEAAAEVLQHS